ncbi:Pumilio like 5 [Apostasia shenzhenica]|uniref:Pumilio like 5 n=1 Tax=Apostasia shenzhenica TaxID=1088818 RepID=A0A2I0BH02_9ASPA|nr:Pumilio like 5 [Apostasia shenzhenica]
MATENPLRLVGSSGVRNWPARKDSAAFSTSSRRDLGLFLEGHGLPRTRNITAPSRSGSAPPSMEGSSSAIGDLRGQQNAGLDAILENLNLAFNSCQSEEQLRSDPAYLAYYHSNVNLNPRLPPPLISQENRRLAHHIGGFGDNWRIPCDDMNKGSLSKSRVALSTHKEEPEDDSSPRLEVGDVMEENNSLSSSERSVSMQGRHKSLVDLIQEDFPRTPSPIYSNQVRSLGHGVTAQLDDSDACTKSFDNSRNNMVNSELKASTTGVDAHPTIPKMHSFGRKSNDDLTSVSTVCSNSSISSDAVSPHLHHDSSSEHSILEKSILPFSVVDTSINSTGNDMKNLKISNDAHKSQPARQYIQQSSLQARGSSVSMHRGQPHLTNHGLHSSNVVDQFSTGQSKLASVELQPVLQSAGLVPPLYATAAAYGTQYYPAFQPTNLFSPQYGVGGYAVNASLMPPFLSGYPSYNAIPVPFDNPTSPNYNARTSNVSSIGNITPGYYGQQAVATQPPYPDSLFVSYFQHPSAHAYASAVQFDQTSAKGSAIGSSVGFDPQKGTLPAIYSSDQRPQVLRTGAVSTPGVRKDGHASMNLYGSPLNVSLFMQYPPSPLASPIYPASPVSNTGISGRRSESNRSPGTAARTGGTFSGWQGPRLRDKVDDSKSHSFLEELKSNKSRRYELSDIAGRIVEFSADQHGSRFIQQKLESCSVEDKASVFEEVLPHASTLMTDVFGNYVIQKFFEHGVPEQRKELANQLVGRMLPLSLQMYGCRVIQKALEVIELDQKTQLVQELDGHVMRCVRDQNGNHVIQKCIECVPTVKIGFIISAFRGHVATLSMHPYGCRVIQRVLEHCTDESETQCVVDEILQSACILAQDQYGNYVTQHVLERGKPFERSQIINKLSGQIVQMSQHKFASNVVEKCLEHGNSAERELLIEEIVGQTEGNDSLLIMMKDQFANYVVQKILDICSESQQELLLSRVRSHLHALKKYTYGKHIVARVEQLCGDEECPALEP